MTATIGLIAKGIGLGLGAAVPIGPVNVQIARQTLRGGFRSGFVLGCGAVTADVVYAILSSVGFGRAARVPAVEWSVRVAGIALLAYLGVLCLRGERKAFRTDPIAAGAADRSLVAVGSSYLTGLAMTLFNPMTLAFWFVAVPALVGSVAGDVAQDLPRVCVGVFIGTIGWVTGFATALALAGRYRRNWWLAAADAVGGATLLVFAAIALLCSLRALL
jgi:threonine/homoserine/homoserine lactone efflux protein